MSQTTSWTLVQQFRDYRQMTDGVHMTVKCKKGKSSTYGPAFHIWSSSQQNYTYILWALLLDRTLSPECCVAFFSCQKQSDLKNASKLSLVAIWPPNSRWFVWTTSEETEGCGRRRNHSVRSTCLKGRKKR